MRSTGAPRSGQDRWLVSYADLVTLLFAFFTTMYASTTADTVKAAAPTEVASAPPEARAAAAERASDALRARLSSRLESAVQLRRADVIRDGRGVVVSLPERAAFDVGSAEVSAEAKTLIADVVAEVAADAIALRIEGHTDDVPIQTPRFRSNWELSTARAGAVVAFLVDALKFPPDRLSAAGYGEFHPIAPNDSPEDRARNRRIDIVVLPLENGAEEARP